MQMKFRQIAGEEYARMLSKIVSLRYSASDLGGVQATRVDPAQKAAA
ncbi:MULTISPECIES: hypothetical protein [unclassified Caballeronia]|nr:MULTISPECIES: hypothetical protein [unclassified Caballeronia]MDR5754332.1 hypothetical protein [Caballeronia sp. LZ024]MDR5840710.1 hypothetical protein [Caballeronia sp. LZ031]